MRAIAFALAIVLCMSADDGPLAASAKPEVQTETGQLTQAEQSTLQRIKGMYEDFVYGPTVRRYFYVDPETGNKIYVTNELVLEPVDGLIAGQYVSYEVQFDPEMETITYQFDAGTAFRGWGTLLVTDDSIVKSDWTCGTAGCGLLVQVNGKVVYESE
jgi:hypothetical protein